MSLNEVQSRAFEFLKECFQNGTAFTKAEFQQATGWGDVSFKTYFSKQFKRLLLEVSPDQFRVTDVFRKYNTPELFETHIVTQNRKVASDYNTLTYNNLIIFEFFMPLTNEGLLRSTLDALFYKDTILNRLKATDQTALEDHFPKEDGEEDDYYYNRMLNYISNNFIGYSISHVNGRFRASGLQTIQDSTADFLAGGRYLVDETTAIVRFIFPIGTPADRNFNPSAAYFDQINSNDSSDNTAEANRIRWFFYLLFVQSIVQVVNGEDEIWMVESGI
jgi:hypothetical protein